MTNDEILQAAKEAGIEKWWDTPNSTNEGYKRALLKMGKIIEKRTIERCAAIADRVEELADALNDKISDDDEHDEGRSEWVMGKAEAASRIAASIRKLGEQ